jgi:hypothetical protein
MVQGLTAIQSMKNHDPTESLRPGEKGNRFQRLGKDERMVRGGDFAFWLLAFLKLISGMIFSEFGEKCYSPGE